MRIAIISDIHGNMASLEAVLSDLGRRRIDSVICLGDVAATGPRPSAALGRLRSLNIPCIMGNTDALLLNPKPYDEVVEELKTAGIAEEATKRFAELDLWCARQLSQSDLGYIRKFRSTIEISLGHDKKLLCFHGSSRSNTDIISSTTPEDELDRMLSGFSASAMAGGHTHAQMLRRHKDTLIVNPGSVGLPYERVRSTGQVRNPPWSEYAIVGLENSEFYVEFHRVPIDVNKVVQTALESDMPHSEWWARYWSRR